MAGFPHSRHGIHRPTWDSFRRALRRAASDGTRRQLNLLKYGEVAERLHVSERTARRMGDRGEILQVRLSSGVLRVTAESVDLYLAEHLGPRRAAVAA